MNKGARYSRRQEELRKEAEHIGKFNDTVLGPILGMENDDADSHDSRTPDALREEKEEGETAMKCTICELPISGGVSVGDGDGPGQRFAHQDCYHRREMNELLRDMEWIVDHPRDLEEAKGRALIALSRARHRGLK